MYFIDSETCGFVGPMVVLQWAKDNDPVNLHYIWDEPIYKTLELIDKFCQEGVCCFNLTYDWFHICKIYNLLKAIVEYDRSWMFTTPPVELAIHLEARNPSKYCLRPKFAIDCMLVARRTSYQHTMKRKSIVVNDVPTKLADEIKEVLEREIDVPAICFVKNKEGYAWRIAHKLDGEGNIINPELADVILDFKPSSSLEALSQDMLNEGKGDWTLPDNFNPTEVSWRPFGQYGETPWQRVIYKQIIYWSTNQKAQYYAWKDVDLLRKIYLKQVENGDIKAKQLFHPELDIDSELCCMAAATRLKGFVVNKEKLLKLKEKYIKQSAAAPRSPRPVLRVLHSKLSEIERQVVKNTKKETLESVVRNCNAEAAEFAQSVLDARSAEKRLTLVDRLLLLEHPTIDPNDPTNTNYKSIITFHPDVKIIGTKSNRMAGGSEDFSGESINPQGIPADKEFRDCFEMADTSIGEILVGGDAVSFEITIIDAVFPSKKLRERLLSGKKFHALMGEIWLDIPYDQIMEEHKQALATGTPETETKYYKSKRGVFSWAYGGMNKKVASVLGIEEEDVEDSNERMKEEYPEILENRNRIATSFCSMRQPRGIGTNVEWHDPEDYIESIFGFRRYFTLENKICKTLYNLARKPPKAWMNIQETIVRKDHRGFQKLGGAVMSAFYAAAFSIQAANMRAACNHVIQSPGGWITKIFQYMLWEECQPIGIHLYKIRILNVHDELNSVVSDESVVEKTFTVRERFLEWGTKHVPLLKWEWSKMRSWAEK